MFTKFTYTLLAASSLLLAGCKSKSPVKSPSRQAPEEHLIDLQTSAGPMLIRLYDETPQHRDNMVKLVKSGFYDGLLFHRIIREFMIQGGDPESRNAPPEKQLGNGDVGYRIPAEFNPKLFHKKGVLAAARDNNPEKASSGCQFYIVQGKPQTDVVLDQCEARNGWKYTTEQRNIYKTIGGTPHLDGAYTVFGEVIVGMDVVDRIALSPTKPGDRPVADVRILKAEHKTRLKTTN